ncbi:MAG: helix-turn-helix transcriptional regulator [Bacillota bacterium]|nr:helix-turn-helix transcriptional regulator [Bacillota bacterium]
MLGLTQRDMALALGYTFQAISKFESEGGALPLSVLPSLANTLQLSYTDIFARNADGEKPEVQYEPIDVDVFTNNIVFLRGLTKYSQAQEANYVEVSKRSIINYEQGASIPNTKVVEGLIELYGVTPEEIIYKDLIKEAEREAILERKKKLAPSWLRPTMVGGLILLLYGAASLIVTPRVSAKFNDGASTTYVSTSTELVEAINTTNTGSIVLLDDIDLSETNWAEVDNSRAFAGTFDGNGHTISNLSIRGQGDDAQLTSDSSAMRHSYGFFSGLRGTVKDVCFDNMSITLAESDNCVVGAVAGTIFGGSVENVIMTSSSINVATMDDEDAKTIVGGLVGISLGNSSIEQCAIFESSLSNESGYMGGIVGWAKDFLGKFSISGCVLGKTEIYSAKTSQCLGIGVGAGGEQTNEKSEDYDKVYYGEDVVFGSGSNYSGQFSSGAMGGNKTETSLFDSREFYVNDLDFSESVWNLNDLSYENGVYPRLRLQD